MPTETLLGIKGACAGMQGLIISLRGPFVGLIGPFQHRNFSGQHRDILGQTRVLLDQKKSILSQQRILSGRPRPSKANEGPLMSKRPYQAKVGLCIKRAFLDKKITLQSWQQTLLVQQIVFSQVGFDLYTLLFKAGVTRRPHKTLISTPGQDGLTQAMSTSPRTTVTPLSYIP